MFQDRTLYLAFYYQSIRSPILDRHLHNKIKSVHTHQSSLLIAISEIFIFQILDSAMFATVIINVCIKILS